eukprot:Nitzschia sp. Nitz4//scaffold9_size221794//17256//17974//NITZ4_001315-RA/size221794-snap-gene-0.119-mRNA-1//-1//CDS//3329560908//5625//frame0
MKQHCRRTHLLALLLVFCVLGRSPATGEQRLGHSDNLALTKTLSRHLEDTEEETVEKLGCTVSTKCYVCTTSDFQSDPSCKPTGRKEDQRCSYRTGDDIEMKTESYSCQYTEAEEGFAMVRFQMLCLVFGSLACMAVRRQKRSSASLFDQRKMAANARKQRPTEEIEIEFTTPSKKNYEEVIPLMDTSNNPLAII